jgi:cell wall-associated NlpC family hydrolase
MDRWRDGGDGWRECLEAYVRRLDRMETGDAPALSGLVEDWAFLKHCGDKYRRLSAGRAAGGRPVRAETAFRPVWTIRRPGGPRVRIRLARRLVYGDGREEERIEQETLDFVCRGGRWTIARLVPDVPEKRGHGGNVPPASGQATCGPAAGSSAHEPAKAGSPARAPATVGLSARAPATVGPSARIPPDGSGSTDGRENRRGARAVRYDREAAKAYADAWWNGTNPKFHRFAVDCTNYVSQCLFAGGLPMDYTGRRDSGWWYMGYAGGAERWSYSWAVAHSLRQYMASGSRPPRGMPKEDPRELDIGDVIFYDWDGDGRWQHSAIVTGRDRDGWPLVNAHTSDSKRRFWDYRDSYAWSTRTRYAFLHVPDEL